MAAPQAKRSLRIYFVDLDDGRKLGVMMRTRESFFDAFPPSAYGLTDDDVRAQLDDELKRLLATREDEIERYLWDETFHTRTVPIDIHPATVVKKQPAIGKRVVPLRLTYAWSQTKGGAYRVMLPRFRWWLLLEDLEIAADVLSHAVSSALLGEDPSWLYEFRRQGDERVEAWAPDWLAGQDEGSEDAPAGTSLAPRPTTATVAEDWVERASKKKLPPIVGEDPAFVREVQRFAQKTPPSVLLVGEHGVGKTTFVRRLARQLLRFRREKQPAPPRLWATSVDRILAGMIYLGMWQERCLAMVEELDGEGEYLYVDRLLDLLRPMHDGSCVADLFAPAVTGGTLPMIAECTPGELVTARRRSSSFVDAFHVIRIDEPRRSAMVPLLSTWAERRGVSIRPVGLERLVRHLDAFSRHVRFPGKGFSAIDWIARDRPRAALDPADVSAAYARMSGLPLDLIADERSATIGEVAARLKEGVVGQDEACARAAEVIARLKAGLGDPERPIGSMLFVGPTGVGKTELAKQLARVLFGDAKRMVRIDLSEFMQPGSIARLVQAGRGVTSLAEQVHRQPMSLVLFDELEKAHPEFFDLLLGILGDGRLTDALGRRVDFRMSVIALTSNLGADARASVGFGSRAHEDYERAVRDFFRPELVNRLDHVVSFRLLDAQDLGRIVDLELARSFGRPGLKRRRLSLLVDPAAREKLAKLGWHPTYGARPLRRVIEERVFTPLAARIASDPSFGDRRVHVVAKESEDALTASERADAILV